MAAGRRQKTVRGREEERNIRPRRRMEEMAAISHALFLITEPYVCSILNSSILCPLNAEPRRSIGPAAARG